MNLMTRISLCLTVFAVALSWSDLKACTRVVYQGPEGMVLTARSMDWKDEIGTNIWVLPRGMTRHGEVGPTSLTWESIYGSVIASGFDIATTDGLNEAGLVVNLHWLVEAEFPALPEDMPAIAVSLWAQYFLDRFATVEEAVESVKNEPFAVFTDVIPGTDKMSTVHLSISDATGDNAIFEYLEGELVVHHGREYQVMTNNPPFPEQLAIQRYWNDIGGTVMLPGTNRPADRFARAMFYVNAIPQVADQRVATAGIFSVIRNVSVPYGISTPGQPHISSTRWRTVSDHQNLLYYFESVLSPSVFWVDLSALDLTPGTPVRKLPLGPNQTRVLSGVVNDLLEETEMFEFAGIEF